MLCERRLNSLLVRQRRALGSHLGPESRPDASIPAERGEPGSEGRSSSCSGTATHWLVKIARLLASVPGLASGFPEQLQHAALPPDRVCWRTHGALRLQRRPLPFSSSVVTALPASAGAGLGNAFVLVAFCKPWCNERIAAAWWPRLDKTGKQSLS